MVMAAGVEASWIRLGDGADTPWWSGHTSIITTGLHLRSHSHSFHTAYIHTNNTFCGHSWLVAYYLNTSLLKSLTILVQIFVENRLDIQAWPRSCYRNAINFEVTRCCECLVAVDSGHLGRGSVTNFLSIYGVKCCSRGRRAAGLQIETIRYGDKKYLSHN